jgi:hypothetical protein
MMQPHLSRDAGTIGLLETSVPMGSLTNFLKEKQAVPAFTS